MHLTVRWLGGALPPYSIRSAQRVGSSNTVVHGIGELMSASVILRVQEFLGERGREGRGGDAGVLETSRSVDADATHPDLSSWTAEVVGRSESRSGYEYQMFGAYWW